MSNPIDAVANVANSALWEASTLSGGRNRDLCPAASAKTELRRGVYSLARIGMWIPKELLGVHISSYITFQRWKVVEKEGATSLEKLTHCATSST